MKSAIVIGASTGIGRETALRLSEKYKNLAVTSFRHVPELESLGNELAARGCRCLCRAGDAADMNFIRSFVQEAADMSGGHIDLLVNNAGISWVGLMSDMTADEFDRLMKTNVYSVFNACNQVVPYMVRKHSGRIINISSVWGNVGASCEAAYSASKGAVNAFSRALGKELAPSGICVNAVAFGAIDTTMNGHLDSDERAELEDEIPAGRFATAAEAADFIAQVADCGEYLNGQVLTFDGAWQ